MARSSPFRSVLGRLVFLAAFVLLAFVPIAAGHPPVKRGESDPDNGGVSSPLPGVESTPVPGIVPPPVPGVPPTPVPGEEPSPIPGNVPAPVPDQSSPGNGESSPAPGEASTPDTDEPLSPADAAQLLADPAFGPIPGMSDIYSQYWGIERPFPANITDPIFPTEDGPPAEDDYIWQNLLAAEWMIFEFYQQGVERFTDLDFVAIGMPPTTHFRLMEIRNNEAGHLRIFQNMISPTSIKPGACKYRFPLTDPLSYLAVMTVIEVSSMAFLTGLVQDAKVAWDAGALAAISQTEARHETWALIDLWKVSPFAGPADTTFPYANQILYSTHGLVVPDSCPAENPEYPTPLQELPPLWAAEDTVSMEPGAVLTLLFPDPKNQPVFEEDTQYYAVFFHGLLNMSIPIETAGFPERPVTVTIPIACETKGIIIALVADEEGAPTRESVVAGPAVILEQPASLGLALVKNGPNPV